MGQLFKDIVGQTNTRNHLIRSVKENRLSHALHFLGPEGSGSLQLALAFAAYVLCSEPGETDACGRCASCVKMASYQHPDLHFVFPIVKAGTNKSVESFMPQWRSQLNEHPLMSYMDWLEVIANENTLGLISVDLIAEIARKVSMKSFEGGYRIAIIWMPELMNTMTANKSLKMLEEPLPGTLFFLVGNTSDNMLPTILSRVQQVPIAKLSNNEVEEALVNRYQVEADRAKSAAFLSDGNLNIALKLASDDESDVVLFELFRDWFRACYQKSEGLKRVALTDEFMALGRSGQITFLTYALQMLRQATMATAGVEDLIMVDGAARQLALNLGKTLNHDQQFAMAKALNEAIYHIGRNASAKIIFMDLSIQLKKLFH